MIGIADIMAREILEKEAKKVNERVDEVVKSREGVEIIYCDETSIYLKVKR